MADISTDYTSWSTTESSNNPSGSTAIGTGLDDNLRAIQAGVAQLYTDITESIIVVCSDETTAIAAGTNKIRFRMPYAFTVSGVRASLNSACTTGTFTVDINEAGTSILSTKLTVDAGEATSTTAATPAVISDTALADDALISIDVDNAGDGTATGLKISIIGKWA